MPPKVFEGAHEQGPNGDSRGHLMDNYEKGVNRALAEHLFHHWLQDRPRRTLDIGSKYPYLAHCFRNLGCQAFGMDNLGSVPGYARELEVPMLLADFETVSEARIHAWTEGGRFQLITLVHVFEHLYEPLAALEKLHRLVAEDGWIFLRLPDHGISGFERDLTPGHYSIHPYFHSLGSLQELLRKIKGLFELAWTEPMAGYGQRDLVLRPLTVPHPVFALGQGGERAETAMPFSLWQKGMGEVPGALDWGRAAQVSVAGPVPGWQMGAPFLFSPSRPALKPSRPLIALLRPGAIGDVVMTLNIMPGLRAKYPDHDFHYFCSEAIGQQLWELMAMAGITQWHACESMDSLRPNYAHIFNLVGYPLQDGYPDKPMAKHLLQYFADEVGLASPKLPRLELPLPSPPQSFGPYATLHATAGWSAYKNWPLERWEAVLAACPHIPVYQLGAATDPRLAGANHDFMGAALMTSVGLIAHAQVHLGVDSFTNHLSHYLWGGRQIPSLILWGSTQPNASGYEHNVNLSLGLACQPCFRESPVLSACPRGPCINPPGQVYDAPAHACMDGISVEQVLAEVRKLWAREVQCSS